MSRACVLVLVLTASCPGPAAAPVAGPTPLAERPAVSPDADTWTGPPGNLRGTIFLNTAAHCGGAAAPRDEPSSYRIPGGGPFHLRPGDVNTPVEPLAQVTTDGKGQFAIDLPAGSYCLIEPAKLDLAPPGQVPMYTDAACLDGWRKTCDAVLTVPAAEPVAIELWHGCFHPCYHGPLPP